MEIALSQSVAWSEAETALVRRVATGEEAALREIYELYGRRLYAYALRLTGHAALAEEVLQDSLFAAWKGARRFRGQSRVLTWLLGIVHHQACNALRRRRPEGDWQEATSLSAADGPDAQTERAERDLLLQQGLQALSREHRAVLALVFYHGLSLAEVAQVCRCPVGPVKSRLSYAKAHLRAWLKDRGLAGEDSL